MLIPGIVTYCNNYITYSILLLLLTSNQSKVSNMYLFEDDLTKVFKHNNNKIIFCKITLDILQMFHFVFIIYMFTKT